MWNICQYLLTQIEHIEGFPKHWHVVGATDWYIVFPPLSTITGVRLIGAFSARTFVVGYFGSAFVDIVVFEHSRVLLVSNARLGDFDLELNVFPGKGSVFASNVRSRGFLLSDRLR